MPIFSRATRAQRTAALLALGAASSIASFSRAAVVPVNWALAQDGTWTDATKWSPAVVPNDGGGNAYNVTIGVTGSPYTVSLDTTPINVSTLTISAGTSTLAIGAGASLTVPGRFMSLGNTVQTGGTLNIPVGTLSTSTILHGSGVYQHSGGAFNFGTTLSVGLFAGDATRYELSGTGALAGTQLNVGANVGNGTFTQSGGTVALGTYLALGDDAANNTTVRGYYGLSGGTLTANQIYVGGSGIGMFAQNGGFVRVPNAGQNFLSIGEDSLSNGTYSLSNGTMAISALVLAHFGSGTFIQSGGSNTINGVMRVGRDAGSKGYYSMSAGTLVVGGEMDLGYGSDTAGGAGTFEQSGGSVSSNSVTYLGRFSNTTGVYKQTGGAFTTPTENVGTLGVGSLSQSGGTHTVSGPLFIAANGSAVSVTGGSISANTTTINGPFTASNTASAALGTVTGINTLAVSGNANVSAKSIRMNALTLSNNGTVSINQNGTSIATSRLTSLSILGNAVLDLKDNDLIVSATTPNAQVVDYVARGYNFGGFDGLGAIQSSSARNAAVQNKTLGVLTGAEYGENTGLTQFDGLSVLLSDSLVKYTYYGDVDFNGQIDASDYNLIDFGYVNGLSGWANGDADYSGSVDASDYNLIDFAYTTQNGVVLRAIQYLDGTDRSTSGMNDESLQQVMSHFDQFGKPYAAGFLATVPEPTSMAAVCISATTLLLTRRRQRRIDA